MTQTTRNIKKIATLLISLGPDQAARILSHLTPQEVTLLVREIAAIGNVNNQTRRAVLREFRTQVTGETAAPGQPARPTGPALLTTITPQRAAELITDEPIHIIILLLAGLPRDTAAAILECLSADLQPRVALGLGRAPALTPELRVQLESAMRTKARRYLSDEELNGRATLRTLASPAPAQTPVPAPAAAPADAPVASSLPALTALDMDTLREVVNGADLRDVCLALRGAGDEFRATCLRALPFRKRMAVQTALRSQQAVRLRDIADAQQRLLARTPVTIAPRERELAHV